jgi:UDP-N-acetylglucosamine 2-epimerase (non-hydrolysing)
MGHLAREGLADRSVLVGDVMVDVLLKVRDELTDPGMVLGRLGVGAQFSVATIQRVVIHRMVLLAHPRLGDKAAAHGIRLDGGSLTTRDPLSYPDLVGAVGAARGVITDSSGLQKEAFVLGTPCTTVRTETQ